jgi:hypothetical protein
MNLALNLATQKNSLSSLRNSIMIVGVFFPRIFFDNISYRLAFLKCFILQSSLVTPRNLSLKFALKVLFLSSFQQAAKKRTEKVISGL